MIGPMTPNQLRMHLANKAGKGLDNLVKNALRRGARRVKTRGIRRLAKKGIAHSIWGKKRSGLNRAVKVGRAEESGQGWSVDIEAKGIPALVEEGGQGKGPYPIKARRPARNGRKLLSFRGSGGRGIADGSVTHPPLRVAKDPWLSPSLDEESPSIERDLEFSLDLFTEAD
jgi:hypothetical protein